MNNLNPKVKGMLSLAMKAGRLQTGEGRAEDTIRGGRAHLIILSDDASANTQKKFRNMGDFRSVPVISLCDRFELGATIGRKFAVIIAVSDEGFANSILNAYNNQLKGE